MKKFKQIFIGTFLFVFCFSFSAVAVTKPDLSANLDNLSYVFYLYYDKGQLFGDRDHEVKFDILNETYVPEVIDANSYRLEILNSKSESVDMVQFDPRGGNPSFTGGKIQVKAPYAASGQRAVFFNNQGSQLVNLFIFEGALCNDDGSCSLAQGENESTCPADCIKKTVTPVPSMVPTDLGGGFDMLTVIIYVVGGLAVVVVAWFVWKWLQKKKEENFLPPPPAPPSLGNPASPFPNQDQSSNSFSPPTSNVISPPPR